VRVLQIVPYLPPPFEGVGAYATALAEALAKRSGVETRFVVGDPVWSGGTANGARAVPARTTAGLLAELEGEETVLLHYANYGYQSRGCPIWLVEGLARWRSGAAGRRLVTLFHEVWASGPPWRSSFWLQPLQRRLAAAAARLSAALATSLDLYAEVIRPWARNRDIVVMPVFSTVGEPEAVPPLAQRARRIVVFGGEGARGRTYSRFLPELADAARALQAEEICDVGPPVPLPGQAGGIPIHRLGVLPPADVSDLLLGSAGGFLAYPPDFLPKSTIFAAYCAHGLLPTCAWDRHPKDGPVVAGRHYWTGSGDLQAIASAAHDWYARHSLVRQAETFRRLLTETAEYP
jgi:hypothetical protein